MYSNCVRRAITRLTGVATIIVGLAVLGPNGRAQTAPASTRDSKLDSPFASFRVGVSASDSKAVDTGLDVTFPKIGTGSLVTRLDVDLTAHFRSASFGSRRDSELAISLCGVYAPGGINRGRYFLGAGVGPVAGPQSGIGGKVFGGINFNKSISAEVEGQFPPNSPVRISFLLRLAAL